MGALQGGAEDQQLSYSMQIFRLSESAKFVEKGHNSDWQKPQIQYAKCATPFLSTNTAEPSSQGDSVTNCILSSVECFKLPHRHIATPVQLIALIVPLVPLIPFNRKLATHIFHTES